MADAHCEQQWDHTASILSLLANTVRDSESRPEPFTPADFHPYHHEQLEEHDGDDVEFLERSGW